MSFDGSDIATIVIGVVGAILTYLGVKVKAKSDKDAAEPASWQSLTTEMKAFFKEQLEERDKRIDALERREVMRTRYDRWLTGHNFPRPPFLTFDEWIATQDAT